MWNFGDIFAASCDARRETLGTPRTVPSPTQAPELRGACDPARPGTSGVLRSSPAFVSRTSGTPTPSPGPETLGPPRPDASSAGRAHPARWAPRESRGRVRCCLKRRLPAPGARSLDGSGARALRATLRTALRAARAFVCAAAATARAASGPIAVGPDAAAARPASQPRGLPQRPLPALCGDEGGGTRRNGERAAGGGKGGEGAWVAGPRDRDRGGGGRATGDRLTENYYYVAR